MGYQLEKSSYYFINQNVYHLKFTIVLLSTVIIGFVWLLFKKRGGTKFFKSFF